MVLAAARIIHIKAVAAGAEAGFLEEEMKAVQDANWQAISLGPLILRAENAAIDAATICQALCGDFN